MADNNQAKITISIWLLCVVPLLFMLLRFYCKWRRAKSAALDDWLLLASWVAILAFTIITQIAVNWGIGRRLVDIPKESLPTAVKFMFIGEYFCFYAMPLGKASFCVTLLRLTTVRWHKVILWTVMLSFAIGMMAVGILQWAQCQPIQKLWDNSVEGHCWNYSVFTTFGIIVGSISSAVDFVLAICPWLIIRKVQMQRREKASLIVAMSMGCLAGIACIVKTTYLPAAGTWNDFTYNVADLIIWAISESSITVVACSLPFLRLILLEAGTHASRHGGSDGSFRLTSRSTRSTRSKSMHTVTNHQAWPVPHRSTYTVDVDKDYESDEKSILADSKDGAGRIVQTQEVRIEFADRNQASPVMDQAGLAV